MTGFHRGGVLASREASYSATDYNNEKEYGYETSGREERQPLTETYDNGAAQLDGRPIYSDARHRQVAEMDGTPAPATYKPIPHSPDESPILGRHQRIAAQSGTASNLPGRRHVMSWNNYDAKEAAALPSTMSSGLSNHLSSPDVSPIPLSTEWIKASDISSRAGQSFRPQAADSISQDNDNPLLPLAGDAERVKNT